jgi:hypothetical protein
MLQKVGIDEIIIQDIADTKRSHAVYPTKMQGYTCNTIDMVGTALEAADRTGMNVRIGLGFSNDWWLISALNSEWLINEGRVNMDIVLEIVTMYGSYKSLTGWYIPYEFHQFTALGHARQGDLNMFFKEISAAIKFNSDKNIMVAPFYNSLLSLSYSFASWSKIVYQILRNTGIDILALQDSVGAGFNTLNNIDEIYRYTKKATDAMGMSLYVITETFDATPNANQPASFNRIRQQMAIVSPYVERFVAFSIDHYENGNEPSQVTGYDEYERYYFEHAEKST